MTSAGGKHAESEEEGPLVKRNRLSMLPSVTRGQETRNHGTGKADDMARSEGDAVKTQLEKAAPHNRSNEKLPEQAEESFSGQKTVFVGFPVA